MKVFRVYYVNLLRVACFFQGFIQFIQFEKSEQCLLTKQKDSVVLHIFNRSNLLSERTNSTMLNYKVGRVGKERVGVFSR